jgi:hypothetical protein
MSERIVYHRRCSWGPSSPAYIEGASEKGQKRVLPVDIIRKIQRASTAGGRATCFVCHQTFSAEYMRYVTVGLFHNDHVCLDCQRVGHFSEVR